MRLQKGKYGCSFLEGPPVVMGHHDTMLLHINTVLILMASFYRVGKIVPSLMIQVSCLFHSETKTIMPSFKY